MHKRRGGKIFSFSRHLQVRTNATATKEAVSAHTHSPTCTVTSYTDTSFHAAWCVGEWMGYSQQQANSPAVPAHNVHAGWSRKMGPSNLEMGKARATEAANHRGQSE